MIRRLCLAFAGLLLLSLLSGCAVIAVADAAVTVVATGVKVAGKAVGAAVDVVTDDDDEDEDEDD